MIEIDPSSPLGIKIRAALRANESGSADPYTLSYAGLGRSGPSFGIFQADMAANLDARSCMRIILVGAGMSAAAASSLVSQLGIACMACPLNHNDEAAVLAAMNDAPGRQMIDAMDDVTLGTALGYVGRAMDAAAVVGWSLDEGASCAVALWANMTGAPTTLDLWLSGEAVVIDGISLAPPAGPIISQTDLEWYLSHTQFFEAHQSNLAHLQASIATGLAA